MDTPDGILATYYERVNYNLRSLDVGWAHVIDGFRSGWQDPRGLLSRGLSVRSERYPPLDLQRGGFFLERFQLLLELRDR